MKTKVLELVFLVLLLLPSFPLFAVAPPPFPKDGKEIKDFVPSGSFILKQATGDLNQDGNEDVVLILANEKEKTAKPGDEVPARDLLILFKTPQGYHLSTYSQDLVLRKDEGGVWGDPLEGIKIEKGTVVLNFYGGSRERWGMVFRFRYQNSDWVLIGKTIFDNDTMTKQSQKTDINYNTGVKEIEVTTASGVKKSKKEKLANKTLLKLSDVNQDNRIKTD